MAKDAFGGPEIQSREEELEMHIRLLIKVAKLGKCASCEGSLAEPPTKGCDSIEHCGTAQIVRDSERVLNVD